MISIIVPVYNQAKKLADCLTSLAEQSYHDIELIVVDDGSSDNPAAVVEELRRRYPQLKLKFVHQANQGSNPARNRGYREASGEYLLFSDADIVWQPEALASLLSALESAPEAAYAYASFRYGAKLFKMSAVDAQRLRQGPCIHTSALIRRRDFPGFDEKIRRFQDWDLWLTILAAGRLGVMVDQTLFEVKTGGHISTWLPSFAYRWLPFLPAVKRYQQALQIVKAKHKL